MDFKQVLANPSAVYEQPANVLDDVSLTDQEKLKILDSWEHDARELQIASEENMDGAQTDLLDEVIEAKRKLGAQ